MSETNDQRLPFFVYGTLRPGCGNHSWALAGKTTHESTAYLEGATMYGRIGFPYVLVDLEGGRTVTGTLCEVGQDRYDEVLEDLDGLEGYRGKNSDRNHYDRIIVTVTTENGDERQAYVYVASHGGGYADRVRESNPIIESGDWIKHTRPVR